MNLWWQILFKICLQYKVVKYILNIDLTIQKHAKHITLPKKFIRIKFIVNLLLLFLVLDSSKLNRTQHNLMLNYSKVLIIYRNFKIL